MGKNMDVMQLRKMLEGVKWQDFRPFDGTALELDDLVLRKLDNE